MIGEFLAGVNKKPPYMLAHYYRLHYKLQCIIGTIVLIMHY